MKIGVNNFLKYLFFVIVLSFGAIGNSCSQVDVDRPMLINEAYDSKLEKLLDFSVPLMGVEELNVRLGSVLLLDAREIEEFEVSHIPTAQYAGYNNFDPSKWSSFSRFDTVVVYCSVGYRSEKIGEKLKAMGFESVYNLYGSIFEWRNIGLPVVGKDEKITNRVHVYNENWGRWLEDYRSVKVY